MWIACLDSKFLLTAGSTASLLRVCLKNATFSSVTGSEIDLSTMQPTPFKSAKLAVLTSHAEHKTPKHHQIPSRLLRIWTGVKSAGYNWARRVHFSEAVSKTAAEFTVSGIFGGHCASAFWHPGWGRFQEGHCLFQTSLKWYSLRSHELWRLHNCFRSII